MQDEQREALAKEMEEMKMGEGRWRVVDSTCKSLGLLALAGAGGLVDSRLRSIEMK